MHSLFVQDKLIKVNSSRSGFPRTGQTQDVQAVTQHTGARVCCSK